MSARGGPGEQLAGGLEGLAQRARRARGLLEPAGRGGDGSGRVPRVLTVDDPDPPRLLLADQVALQLREGLGQPRGEQLKRPQHVVDVSRASQPVTPGWVA